MDALIYKGTIYGGGGAMRGNYFNPIIYSTEEREVGVWTDNKPLYEKTVWYNNAIPYRTWTTLVDDSNITIVDHEGTIYIDGSPYSDMDYHRGVDSNEWVCSCKANNGTKLQINQSFYGYTITCRATYRYTKIADVAGSGAYNTLGVPNVHYTTEEQVIGTWIDGKPIYQKTYNINETIYNQDKTIDVSSLNIKKYINGYGTFIRNVNWASPIIYLETPFNLYESNSNHSYLRYGKSSNTIDYGVYLGNNETATDITFTIQYTKTTD